jgi:L-ascorbate metabolism protein UlaG (beta-lactamase superfamily)
MGLSRRRLFAGLSAIAAAGGAGLTLRSAQARYYDGPVSDHFDGTRFFDPNGAPPRSLTALARWMLGRKRPAWPEHVLNSSSDRPPARVEGPAWRISYIGHASLLIQTAGFNILTDPIWSQRASPFALFGPKRVTDPGVPFQALPPIDIVLLSHNHYDHLDLPTLSRLAAAHHPRVIMPLGNDSILRAHDSAIRAEAYDWGDRVMLGPDMAVKLAPMRHWSARHMLDRNKALWAAFVIETPAGRIYHVGDSGYGEGEHFRTARAQLGPFRLAILPIGAYEPRWFMRDQHMNPEESVRAFLDCGAEWALGHHYGTFQLTDEAIDAPLQALAEARAQAGVTPERFRTLAPGEVWEL